jgi:hypothetical protein
MRRARFTPTGLLGAGAIVAVLLLVACARGTDAGAHGDDATPSDTPTSDTPTSDQAVRRPTPTGRLPEATELELEAGAVGSGLPSAVAGTFDSGYGAAWSPAEGLLFVITYGSSSCPRIADPEATADGDAVRVRINDPRKGICTADWAPTTTVVAVPDGVDAEAPVTVTLGAAGTVEVEPRPAAGEPGPPAWVPAS